MKLPMLDADTANHAVYGAAIALAAMLLATAAGARIVSGTVDLRPGTRVAA